MKLDYIVTSGRPSISRTTRSFSQAKMSQSENHHYRRGEATKTFDVVTHGSHALAREDQKKNSRHEDMAPQSQSTQTHIVGGGYHTRTQLFQ